MKFIDGNWMIREGVSMVTASHPHDVRCTEKTLEAYASPRDLHHRWAQLDLPLLTVSISSPLRNVIRVRAYHHAGQVDRGPEFAIAVDESVAVQTGTDDEQVYLTSGDLSVMMQSSGDWGLQFTYKGQRITGSQQKSLAYITKDERVYMREELDLGVGEHIYGLGERFTPFIKNGQSVDIWNRDGGTGTEQAYKNVPFYLSNKGYGLFVNHPEQVSYEIGSERVSKVQFSVEGEMLEYFIIGGDSHKDILQNYTTLLGKPALPPAWSFGLWLTTSFTTDYDEQTVNSFVDGMLERDIPLRVFHFDCFWMKALHWTDFTWDSSVFPDPEGMLKRLKAKGLKICVWINPYIAQQSRLFPEAVENGYLIKRTNGDTWQWDRWQPGMGIVDFTNPAACEWYAEHLRRLVDMGVDSFKTDFGERIPTDDVMYNDRSDPQKMHNYYSFLFNKVAFEVLEEKLGKGNGVLFARSATAGGQQFPVHWGGDCFANYESMAESLRGGLSLGLSGFGFWSHDIGGFESTAPADLYKRWTAFGLLSSHSRLHGNSSYRVPWIYDEEAVDVMRFFTKLKYRLMPYIYGAACEAATIGLPMMRAMVLEFPYDITCQFLDRQYMLGESLLVAPIFNEEGVVTFYLPEGTWTDLLSGRQVEGGTWQHEAHNYKRLPLYVRPNTLLAIGHRDDRPDYDYAHEVGLHLFALDDEEQAICEVYNTAGERQLHAIATRTDGVITIQVSNDESQSWHVVLRNIHQVKQVRGGVTEQTEHGLRISPEQGVTNIEVRL